MNPGRLLNQTGTFTIPTAGAARDDMGDPIATTTTRTFRCLIQQANRDEDTAGTNVQGSRWRLFIDKDAAGIIDGTASVTIAGKTYELDGPPWEAFNPRLRRVTHLEADARRTI